MVIRGGGSSMAASDSSSADNKNDCTRPSTGRLGLEAAFCLGQRKRSAYIKSRNGRTRLRLSLSYARGIEALEHL